MPVAGPPGPSGVGQGAGAGMSLLSYQCSRRLGPSCVSVPSTAREPQLPSWAASYGENAPSCTSSQPFCESRSAKQRPGESGERGHSSPKRRALAHPQPQAAMATELSNLLRNSPKSSELTGNLRELSKGISCRQTREKGEKGARKRRGEREGGREGEPEREGREEKGQMQRADSNQKRGESREQTAER